MATLEKIASRLCATIIQIAVPLNKLWEHKTMELTGEKSGK
jgi:hypothetical protein